MSTAAPDVRPEIFEWPGMHGTLSMRLYRGNTPPRGAALLVFFHPGGFVSEDLEASNTCLGLIAATCHINVLAPSYALAPVHPFPAAVEDAHHVLIQAVRHRSLLGWQGTYLFVAGVEAGGNLAAVSALVCRDRQGPKLTGQILITPMLDASLHCDSMRHAADSPEASPVAQAMEHSYRSYLPNPSDRLHPYASPLQASRLTGLPPALVMYAEGDPLADEGLAYADKLRAAGVAVQCKALLPAVLHDARERCQATADSPGMTALAAFLAPYVGTSAGASAPTDAAHQSAAQLQAQPLSSNTSSRKRSPK